MCPEECIQLLADELEQKLGMKSYSTLEQLQVSAISFDDFTRALINIGQLLNVNLAFDLSELHDSHICLPMSLLFLKLIYLTRS